MFKTWQKSSVILLMVGIISLLFSSKSQAAPTEPTAAGDVSRISEATTELNGHSYMGDMSADGRYMVFSSSADNVVPDDTNGESDIFMYDSQTETITRVSVASNGTEADDGSGWPVISGNGRYVAFNSDATNLVNGDTNGNSDIFVHDTQSGITTRVSIDTNGTQGNGDSGNASISADGRYVTFNSGATNLVSSDTNGTGDVFIHDTQTGATNRVSVSTNGIEANGSSSFSKIAANGPYVVFFSDASNLVTGDTNGADDVFRHDVQSGETIRVSVATGGAEGNGGSQLADISADGRYVAFESWSDNLVSGDANGQTDVFLRDIQMETTNRVSIASNGMEGDAVHYSPAISNDGRYVIFASNSSNLVSGITTGTSVGNIFRRDTQMNTTIRVSVASDGTESDGHSNSPALSDDGRYVAFYSGATTLIDWDGNSKQDIFLHDVQTGTTNRISLATNTAGGNGSSRNEPAISADGHYVAFSSFATNLAGSDTNFSSDVFVRETLTGVVRRVSVASDGSEGNNSSYPPTISANGRYVVFASRASNLVNNDTNGQFKDIFVHDLETGITSRVSVSSNGTETNGDSSDPVVSNDGRYVAFTSEASNLVSGDTNGEQDVFLHDTQTGITSRVSVASAGTESNDRSVWPAISSDGRIITFGSHANNLVNGDTNNHGDVFMHDVQQGTTTRVSVSSNNEQANGSSLVTTPDISADGRYIIFLSAATNLVDTPPAGALRIFIRDIQLNTTSQVGTTLVGGGSPDGVATTATISDDGRYVAFSSTATNLVSGDTNEKSDVFVHDRETGGTMVASQAMAGMVGNDGSDYAVMSGNGRFVAFYSYATDLIEGDTNEQVDVFLYEVEEITIPTPTFTIYLPMIRK
jgi:Tol biopolymer transport system component